MVGSENRFAETRAISPVIGVILLVAIGIVLSVVTGAVVFQLTEEENPSPNAAIVLDADPADDNLTLEHDGGEPLDSNETRIVLTVDGSQFELSPTNSSSELTAGGRVTFSFDGTTGSTGGWTGYDSPGDIDIQTGDSITATLYDVSSNKPIVEKTISASSGGTDSSDSGDSDDGVTLTVNEYCAGTSVSEDELEDEDEDEDGDDDDYDYTYNYTYDYENGNYRYYYDYRYVWSEDAIQDPNPDPNPPDSDLACSGDADADPDPDPDPDSP